MARITHIAVKVEDLDRAADFYEQVFGLTSVGRSRGEGRNRAAFSDGQINLTLLKYDSEEEEMAKAVGAGPAIHHFAIEVDDVPAYVEKLKAFDCELLSDPTQLPVKFRLPGGPIAELVPEGSFAGGRQRGRG
jgi:catechol 2,3-dioxygenase-like lactoylglutathione lyase family enzyme